MQSILLHLGDRKPVQMSRQYRPITEISCSPRRASYTLTTAIIQTKLTIIYAYWYCPLVLL